MSAKKTEAESTATTGAPIKRLTLKRERVRDLGLKTGVRTGLINPYDPPPSQGGSGAPTTGDPTGNSNSAVLSMKSMPIVYTNGG
jgi:hypothetical protein